MAGTTINPYRFGGQVGYRRDGANRNYVRARHLDTQRGRWISRDPIGFEGEDWNLYRYAYNSLPFITDPSGFAPNSPSCRHPCNSSGCCNCKCCHQKYGDARNAIGTEIESAVVQALHKYCTKTCPNLTATDFLCQVFAESDGNPRAATFNSDGCKTGCFGLFQISRDIWKRYNCVGPFMPNVYNPVLNADCAMKAICRSATRYFHCSIGSWGTNVNAPKYRCCQQCDFWS